MREKKRVNLCKQLIYLTWQGYIEDVHCLRKSLQTPTIKFKYKLH